MGVEDFVRCCGESNRNCPANVSRVRFLQRVGAKDTMPAGNVCGKGDTAIFSRKSVARFEMVSDHRRNEIGCRIHRDIVLFRLRTISHPSLSTNPYCEYLSGNNPISPLELDWKDVLLS